MYLVHLEQEMIYLLNSYDFWIYMTLYLFIQIDGQILLKTAIQQDINMEIVKATTPNTVMCTCTKTNFKFM